MDIDALESIAREMDATALLIDAAGAAETLSVADIGPGLHDLLRRWGETVARAAASARTAGAATEVFTITLDSSEAAALRARAAAYSVTPEGALYALVDAAIQRHRADGCWP